MEEDRPSATAEGAATLRAAHQVLDDPRVLEDPIAVRLIGAERAAALRSETRLRAHRLRHLRAFVAVRGRYAEDELARAVGRGVRQYVVLGAGLDTFAYRNPGPAHVFEVDHPATQAWKRQRLREAGIAIPASLTFVPVDFERQTLAEGLAAARFDRGRPAFFSWLGVTVYLTRKAVMETLRLVSSSTVAGSGIVLSFVVSRSPIAARTAAIGEPWLTLFDPGALADDLRAMGFGPVEHLPPAEINRRYFADRSDGLRVASSGHMMKAEV